MAVIECPPRGAPVSVDDGDDLHRGPDTDAT
jgi:hypothetical protein